MTTRGCALRDDQWERIKDVLPGRTRAVGVSTADNRLFVEALLYRYHTGIPWRDLPKVHTRYRCWAKTGVWEQVFAVLAADADHEP